MCRNHFFDTTKDSHNLAMEILSFLKKWGMSEDVRIFTGGSCYSLAKEGILRRDESHPEKYTEGLAGIDRNGKSLWKSFSNPERLLDMTFEGPFCLLLRHHEYEVNLEKVSDEAREILSPKASEYKGRATDFENGLEAYVNELAGYVNELIENGAGWDPAEYDSYEEWLSQNEFDDMSDLHLEPEDIKGALFDLSPNVKYLDLSSKYVPFEHSPYEEYLDYYPYEEYLDYSPSEEYFDFSPSEEHLDFSPSEEYFDFSSKEEYFSSKEEYFEFLTKAASAREAKIAEYFEDILCEEEPVLEETFFDDGTIADRIISEFDDLLEKYGLWYELGFNWSLTAHRL